MLRLWAVNKICYNGPYVKQEEEAGMSEQEPPHIGSQLRMLREQRGHSIRALAELGGISPNTVSLIERGATSPSVSTLHRLAIALKVPITVFFQGPSEKVRVIRSRPGERAFSGSASVLLESLGSGLDRQTLEPFLVTLQPGADSGTPAMVHTGHELVFCLRGELEYRIEGKSYRLSAGESLLFEANLPHFWHNPSEVEPSVFLLIFQSAEVGEPLVQHLHP
jgi:transcriptional regulator with XRE-family HTH domain